MYRNPYTPGYEVLSKSGYFIDSHGSLSNTPNYLITNDFPDYAAMFYSPTNHEVMTSVRYGNFDAGYDNLHEIRESLINPQTDLYIPGSFFAMDGAGRQDKKEIVVKDRLIDRVNKEAMQEIAKAQKEVGARKIRRIEFEDILLFRRIKKTIVFDEEKDI